MPSKNKPASKLPGVLAFQRSLLLSDAAFYSVMPDGSTSPVQVIRHGIRGTQNTNQDGNKETSTTGTAERVEVSQIQITDSARLDCEAVALEVRFDLRMLDLKGSLFTCALGKKQKGEEVAEFRASFDEFIERAYSSAGLQEVARRIARNIFNGRWLWRNRTLACAITVRVTNANDKVYTQDALAISTSQFGDYSAAEISVGNIIAEGLCGNTTATTLRISATLDFGLRGAVEVYPSQNYVEEKPKGFARPLYALGVPEPRDSNPEIKLDFVATRVMGHAALRDQKVSNALRTIDTWYPAYPEIGRPIPVEPNGANLDAQRRFRDPKTNTSAWIYAGKMRGLDPDSDGGMYMIASLIRGGVFSSSTEEKKNEDATE
ncbi:type I-F CRISPR-associated protein Csy3 [Amantichitinum ursilacus]|uniref:CRISPR-associated protein Csy3 n=1 Tax=Amantichitinum ursilacus TaxID=857265 RepID=A0A0N0XJE1_9NEIS|nr:type I-F CRISPR-associated protein Csy3 [Amantichitinum ursilacus]KPC53218.1 CRISPR-associated protein Csy3 [Amantichitinum ursilacus]